jgi:hypothetical protein
MCSSKYENMARIYLIVGSVFLLSVVFSFPLALFVTSILFHKKLGYR